MNSKVIHEPTVLAKSGQLDVELIETALRTLASLIKSDHVDLEQAPFAADELEQQAELLASGALAADVALPITRLP